MSKVDPHTRDILSRCKSPIEKSFLQAMLRAGWRSEPQAPGLGYLTHPSVPGAIEVQRELEIGGLAYVADFFFFCNSKKIVNVTPFLICVDIELDGHDFHQSKEAVARDRSRDRAFARAGFHVLRFTGAEVHANAGRCVDEMRETIEAIAERTMQIIDEAGEP